MVQNEGLIGRGEVDGESKSDEDETRGRMMTHGGLN